jgi:hypothetical protein
LYTYIVYHENTGFGYQAGAISRDIPQLNRLLKKPELRGRNGFLGQVR